MKDAERLPNGNIRAPVRLESDGVIGDGVIELAPGDDGYDEWDAFLNGETLPTKALDLQRWEAKALKRLKDRGRADAPFESDLIEQDERERISAALKAARDADDVKRAFKGDALDALLDDVDDDARAWADEAVGE